MREQAQLNVQQCQRTVHPEDEELWLKSREEECGGEGENDEAVEVWRVGRKGRRGAKQCPPTTASLCWICVCACVSAHVCMHELILI